MTHNSWVMNEANMEYFIKHLLPLGAAVLAGGIAWGAQQEQIKSLEKAITTQTAIQTTQTQIRVEQAETKAQARQAADLAQKNHDLLLQLLQRLQ
jgi:hypothetical protein